MNRHIPIRAVPRQDGAALIVSLILLVVLTLIGLGAMNQSSLEEKMASNMQRSVQAFQLAETSLALAFDDNDMWQTGGGVPKTQDIDIDVANINDPGETIEVEYESNYRGTGPVPADQLWSVVTNETHHFDLEATATGPVFDALGVRVHAGVQNDAVD